jgi:hypothetical protein
VLVIDRLTARSEHGLPRWLETDFVCDRHAGNGGIVPRDVEIGEAALLALSR